MILLCCVQNILFPSDDFRFFFHSQYYNPLLLPCPLCPHLTACTPTKSNLYLANSLPAAVNEPALNRLLTFHVPNLMSLVSLHTSSQSSSPCPRLTVWMFRNRILFTVKSCKHFVQPPKLEDHPLSVLRDCLFNTFAGTLYIGVQSSIRNLRTCHAVVTGTHLSRGRSNTPSLNVVGHYQLKKKTCL